MFKNTTRRGLAIGAALALAFSGLASAPAQAAGEVVLAPSAGTSYNTLVTENFTLQASLAPGQNPATAVQLKYKIEKAAGASVSYAVATASPVTTATSSLNAASTSVVVAATDASSTTQNFIKLAIVDATSVSATANVTVTAFVDSNNNSTLDSGEFATSQVVSFKKYSEVASAVALTQPNENDTTIKGTASLTGINTNQVQTAVTFVASIAGAATGSATLDTDTSVYSTAVAALAASTTVSAVVKVGAYAIGDASATYTVAAAAVKAITSSAVTGDNAKNASAGAVTARNTSSFQIKANVKNGTTTTASAVAGVAVTAAITSTGLSATKVLTINGTAYTVSSTLPTALALTSDANGDVVVNVQVSGYADAATIGFTFTSQNLAADALTVTLKDTVYTVANDGTAYAKTTLGSAYTLGYTVKDQWSVLSPKADRLKVTAGTDVFYANLSGGKASVTFTAPTTSGTVTVTNNELQAQDAQTLNWAERAGSFTASAVAVLVTSTADAFDTAPVTASASISRVVDSALTNEVALTGSVNNAGAKVTVAADGVEFSTDGGETTSVGSIVLSTDASGNFTVDAYAHTAGTHVVTYTVGTAVKTANLVVSAAVASEGKTLSITTNAVDGYAAPGSTVRGSVKLVDEYGNPVAAGASQLFGVTVAGPGFVSALPTTTGTDGNSAVFSILLGSADSGDLVITATYDADGATTTIAAITSVATVTVGTAPAADQKLTVGTFNGYIAIYAKGYEGSKLSAKVAGKWLTVAELSNFQRVVRKTGAGYSIKVDLYIDGVFVQSSTTVTK